MCSRPATCGNRFARGGAATYVFRHAHLGRINPRPIVRIVCETPSTATVDGDNGLGLVVGPWANTIAMDKAEAVGSGWVSVQQYEPLRDRRLLSASGSERDLIGWAMTNSSKLVAPIWGAERMLGYQSDRNCIPGVRGTADRDRHGNERRRLRQDRDRQRKDQPLEDGWAVDDAGAARAIRAR